MLTEVQYETEIDRLESEVAALRRDRKILTGLAFDIKSFCPRGDNDKRTAHDFTVVRAEDSAVFGGQSVRFAEYACPCGATMSIQDGQSKVGG